MIGAVFLSHQRKLWVLQSCFINHKHETEWRLSKSFWFYSKVVSLWSKGRLQSFNTLRPRQNGCHFADIFKCILLSENFWSSNKIIFLKYVSQGLIENKPALVQIMAWRWAGDNHYLNQWWPSLLMHKQSWRGVYWFHLVRLSVPLSVPLSVCGQNRDRSVSSTLLVGSISYLHILSRNFRSYFAISKFQNLNFWQIL